MVIRRFRIIVISLLWLPVALFAADDAASVIGAGQWIKLLLGMAAILLLIFGSAWMVKRLGGMSASGGGTIKVLAVLPLGTRERVALIEVGGQQILIGVTAQQVTTLHTFSEAVVKATDNPKNSEFAQKLHRLMSRN